MKDSSKQILVQLFEHYPVLAAQYDPIVTACKMVRDMFGNGGTLFTCGNGGSAADAEHIVGELLKSFRKERPIDGHIRQVLCAYGEEGERLAHNLQGTLPCVALTSHISLSTAYANDVLPQATFAQQLLGLGKQGDCLLTISTSGNSQNCVYAAMVARAMGIKIIALTGEKDSRLKHIADVTIQVPAVETYQIQELHLPVYHAMCAFLEEEFF